MSFALASVLLKRKLRFERISGMGFIIQAVLNDELHALQNEISPNTNTTAFNCTETCPPEYPFRAIAEDNNEPYCSVEPSGLTLHL